MALKLRCAIYTRKSTEEGLDQHFNSLHAQREACEAYIKSQAGEGWTALKDPYDDGGFSGGSMERPALARLLGDIAAGRIDVVVVYKVDRLTRSLADFAKIVEAFDAKGVSFVSVTQAFNTTTSMGRLTLNVLLSFAQFEREVTGERIRDKIAASKAKGMWMGGNLPLGYDAPTDPVTRALVVNSTEAETVRMIFGRYLELGSVHGLKRWLDSQGVRSKAYTTSKGVPRGGALFSRGALFHLLKNRTYLGEVPHRDQSYPGAHPAIVDVEVFEAVQTLLASQTRRHADRPLRSSSAWLKGRIFDDQGEAMSPTYTRGPKGQAYCYYVSTSLQAGRAVGGDYGLRRVSAQVIERIVSGTLRPFAGDTEAATDLASRVEVHADAVHVLADRARLLGRPGDAADDLATLKARLPLDHRVLAEDADATTVRVINPVRLKVRGGRMLITDADGRAADTELRADPVLIRALRAAHALLARIGEAPVARPEQVLLGAAPANPYERNLIKLAFLAPDLQAAILEGRQPPTLTLQALIAADLPAAWPDQRAWVAALA
ncbi:recombinase family protein [Phenylobacterium sp.]|uniref:recombinase family protein n=1 Tax=Phenylobacterium sp. TaxID=1871053 RepID=UPI003BA9490D